MNENQTPINITDVRLKAVGNLAFLLSVIRCGEQLSDAEEKCIQETITELKASAEKDQQELAQLRAKLDKAESERDGLRKLVIEIAGRDRKTSRDAPCELSNDEAYAWSYGWSMCADEFAALVTAALEPKPRERSKG